MRWFRESWETLVILATFLGVDVAKIRERRVQKRRGDDGYSNEFIAQAARWYESELAERERVKRLQEC